MAARQETEHNTTINFLATTMTIEGLRKAVARLERGKGEGAAIAATFQDGIGKARCWQATRGGATGVSAHEMMKDTLTWHQGCGRGIGAGKARATHM